jgi:hypothetical protein
MLSESRIQREGVGREVDNEVQRNERKEIKRTMLNERLRDGGCDGERVCWSEVGVGKIVLERSDMRERDKFLRNGA